MKNQELEHVAMFEYAFPILEWKNVDKLTELISAVEQDNRISPKLVKYAVSKLALVYVDESSCPSKFHALSAASWLKFAEGKDFEISPLLPDVLIEKYMGLYSAAVAQLDNYIKNSEDPTGKVGEKELELRIDNIVRETTVNIGSVWKNMEEYRRQQLASSEEKEEEKEFFKYPRPVRIRTTEYDRDFGL